MQLLRGISISPVFHIVKQRVCERVLVSGYSQLVHPAALTQQPELIQLSSCIFPADPVLLWICNSEKMILAKINYYQICPFSL